VLIQPRFAPKTCTPMASAPILKIRSLITRLWPVFRLRRSCWDSASKSESCFFDPRESLFLISWHVPNALKLTYDA